MKTHGSDPRGGRSVARSPLFEGRFGRMFRRLPPAPPYPLDQLEALAAQMREPDQPSGWGGTPAALDNPAIPAGYTYLGQFIDHDITFDPVSSLERLNDPDGLTSFRTPRFDLDSLYGSGPADEPFQYDRNDDRKLFLATHVNGVDDLPRNAQDIALIGDPRNDENVIISQLHLVFARLHNRLVDQLTETISDPQACFLEAQRLTRWHYQWIVVNDYLPRTVGVELMADMFDPATGDIDLRYYRARTRPYIPVEFSAAGFRFGHSQVRGVYDLNPSVTQRPIFAAGDAVGPLDDLRGRRSLPSGWTVDWSLFFGDGSTPQPSRLVDARLVPALFDLPGVGAALAVRNLQRGQALQLPSGQDVARLLKTDSVLGAGDLGAPEPTPLWFYLLKEAELVAGGTRLGPVGGRIVAEVLLGLLRGDVHSFANVDPTWTPTIPDADGDGRFTMADLVAFALS